MGKSYSKRSQFEDEDDFSDNGTIFVNLDEIYVSESTWKKLLDRDFGQIEKMRQDFEYGKKTVRVVLRPRVGGGYNVEDGRHRVIAAKLASAGYIEALIIGS